MNNKTPFVGTGSWVDLQWLKIDSDPLLSGLGVLGEQQKKCCLKEALVMIKAWIRDLLFRLSGLYVTRTHPEPNAPCAKPGFGFEDLVTLAMTLRRSGLNVLQVGAYDGVSFDPIYDAVSSTNAKIILVEPNSEAVHKLQLAYAQTPSVTIIQAAIVENCGADKVALYRFSSELINIYPDFGGTSSLSKRHLEDAFKRNRHRFKPNTNFEDNVTREEIRAITAKQLIKEFKISVVDLLVIDTEGTDFVVLWGLLEAGLRPSLIQFESRFLTSGQLKAASAKLRSLNYLLRDFGEDTVAIRSNREAA